MFKKFKAIKRAIKNHVVYKDFVFQFFGVDTYKDATTGKKLIPIDMDYYEWPLLIIHIFWSHWYTFWFGMWVSFFSLPEYFRRFFLRDLWWVVKEIAYAFWIWRLPFVVTYINFAEYWIEFRYWWWAENNKKKYPHKKAIDYIKFLRKYKILFCEKFVLKVIWISRHSWTWYIR